MGDPMSYDIMDERKQLVILIVDNIQKTKEGQIKWQDVADKFSDETGEVVDKNKLKKTFYNARARDNNNSTKTTNRKVSIKNVNVVNSPNAQLTFNIQPPTEPGPSIADRMWSGIKRFVKWVAKRLTGRFQ